MTQQITIIGVGLIGGSFALALRESGLDAEFVGCGRSEQTLKHACELGIVDRYSVSVKEAVSGSDVVMLAMPVGAMDPIMAELSDAVAASTVVTDAGSVKQSVIASARKHLVHFQQFVPAHPIAGTEHSGVEAGFASLYNNKRVILTPQPETSAEALEQVQVLWEMTGAKLESMTADRHDKVFAATSHLPHLLAFSLVETLYRMEQKDELLRYAAGGFSDFTRIASSDPVMWRDICLHNKDAVLGSIESLQKGLDTLVGYIEKKDGHSIEQIFQIAKDTRDNKIVAGISVPDGGAPGVKNSTAGKEQL